MIKNTPHNEYFLRIIKNIDEMIFLNSDLNGQDTPELKNTELKYNKEKIVEFCKKNSISENILFLSTACLALNKFNFSNKNLIFHENNMISATDFEDRNIFIKDYLQQIQKDYQENLKYINFSINELIGEYVYGIFAIQKEHSDLHVHHLKLKPS